jgi:hypothetical protein
LYGGGVHLAGNNNRVSNVKIYGKSSVILAREVLGLNHVFENIQAYTTYDSSDPSLSSRRPIDIGGNSSPISSDTKFGGTVIFSNISVEAPVETRDLIQFRNRGFVGDWYLVANNITYNAPNGTLDVVRISSVSGSDPIGVAATNIHSDLPPLAINTISVTPLVRQDLQSGFVTWTTDTGASFVDVTVTFSRAFAKKPSVLLSLNETSDGSNLLISYARTPVFDAFTARLNTVNGNNFTQVIDRTGSWTATLWEW